MATKRGPLNLIAASIVGLGETPSGPSIKHIVHLWCRPSVQVERLESHVEVIVVEISGKAFPDICDH